MWGASAKLLSDNGLREGSVRLWDRGVRGNKVQMRLYSISEPFAIERLRR
jgi:hypothetical protein